MVMGDIFEIMGFEGKGEKKPQTYSKSSVQMRVYCELYHFIIM